MRLSEAEARRIDRVRGPLSRSAWLRWQALKVIGSDEGELTGSKPPEDASTP